MEIVIAVLLLVVGFVMLVKGADWFVDGASAIASRFGIPQIIIGLTIVAMGTSAPEAAVSIAAAFKGSADITIGNIVGSNILNILIILGLSAVITSLAVDKGVLRIDAPFVIIITAVLLVMGLDGTVSRLDGVILWVLFIAYLAYLFWQAMRDKKEKHQEAMSDPKSAPKPVKNNINIGRALLSTVVGLVLIVIGSDIAVDGATTIARIVGISERFIGLTIVALGTSLPELFTSVTAARKGNADIAIGNIIGSNIFNILFVVGTSALIVPVPFSASFIFDTAIAIAAAVLLLICCLGGRLKRWGGVLLLLGYAAYFVTLCI